MYQFSKDDQYFLALESGETGINLTAIAKLSGVDHKQVSRLVEKSVATLSNYEPLQCFYKKSEADYLINYINSAWQSVYHSNYAYPLIAYFASVTKNSDAIDSIVRIGNIGLRSYIHHVTGFQVHLGGQSDLNALHDRLDISNEMLRRTEHKVANLEYFRDNISDIWQHLLEFQDGNSYYKDLSVLPPQVQRNAFKYINGLKEIFWYIYKLRKDCGVSTLDQLSKDRIEIVLRTIPATLTTTRGVPGRGCDLKTWQWDKLFSLDFNTLYEETLESTNKQGVSKFGRRKDITKLVCKKAEENRLVADEKSINEIVERFKADYPERLNLFEINDLRSEKKLEEGYLLERLIQSDGEKGKLLEKDYPLFDENFKLWRNYRNTTMMMNVISGCEHQIQPVLHHFYHWAKDIIDLIPYQHIPFSPARCYYPTDSELYIKEQYRDLPYLARHHFYFPQVFDAIKESFDILLNQANRYNVPYKNRVLMLKLYERNDMRGHTQERSDYWQDIKSLGDCVKLMDKWHPEVFNLKDCIDHPFDIFR